MYMILETLLAIGGQSLLKDITKVGNVATALVSCFVLFLLLVHLIVKNRLEVRVPLIHSEGPSTGAVEHWVLLSSVLAPPRDRD